MAPKDRAEYEARLAADPAGAWEAMWDEELAQRRGESFARYGITSVVITALQQPIKDGIAVKARQAAPHQTSVPVDQRSDSTIANNAEIKTAQVVTPSS